MLSEVEQYFNAVAASAAARDERFAVIRRGESGLTRTARTTAVLAHHEATVNNAWALMGALSDDKLVAWISATFARGTDGWHARGEAEAVLKALPLDAEGLREFALSKGWCDSFEEYLRRAIEAGAVSDGPVQPEWVDAAGVAEALERLMSWVRSHVSASREQLGQLREYVLEVASQAIDAQALIDAGVAPVAAPQESVSEGQEESAGVALDISEWPEWEALRVAANREMSPAYIETLKGHVTAVAVFAAGSGGRALHTVESSAAAVELRRWVTSIGGESRLAELRRLVEPIVVRAARG